MSVRFEPLHRRSIIIWQLLLLGLGTSWLLAPILNNSLSYRASLISQYEASFQPWSWLFRTCDALSGLLVVAAAFWFLKDPAKKYAGWLLAVIGVGIFLDPLFATTCHMQGNVCREYVSTSFLLHATETVITSTAFFVIAIYDSWLRKKLVSLSFALFQVAYGVLFVTQLASHDNFNTVSQYIYQTSLIAWLAWFCRDFLRDRNFRPGNAELRAVKLTSAVWAFVNGILAIVISLAHIHLLGRIKGLYFAGDSAWLAQHGVIIGVVMLYISRHLARGEMRARQIFLAITGIETLKYAVVSPNMSLMLIYALTFIILFVLRDDFDRGTIPLTWRLRLRELYFMVGALGLAAAIALVMLDRDSKVSIVTGRAFDNFFDYIAGSDISARSHLRSALLAHTISAFIAASLGAILWILFKPYKNISGASRDETAIRTVLAQHSNSSEDFFKLWPPDKDYFWQSDGQGFVAYKLTGSIAFGLADPVSAKASQLLESFNGWCRSRRLRSCFFPIYPDSLSLYEKAGFSTIQIGSSAVIRIETFLNETVNDKWWRWQRNRAVKAGYTHHVALPPHSDALLNELERVSNAWLGKSGHVERGFALGYFEKDYLAQCRIDYLTDSSGTIQAFINMLPQFNPRDLVTIDLLRHLPEANNAMPFLIYKMIESVAEDNQAYKFFDLGFVPFAKAKGPLLAIAKALSTDRFSARGLEQFKNKFNPEWRPNYMAYDGDLADLAAVALNLEKVMELSNDS